MQIFARAEPQVRTPHFVSIRTSVRADSKGVKLVSNNLSVD
jgi:hypothetical protein